MTKGKERISTLCGDNIYFAKIKKKENLDRKIYDDELLNVYKSENGER